MLTKQTPATPTTVNTNAAVKTESGKDMAIDLGGGVKMEFVWVDALKGWVGKYEVTNQEYRRFKKDHDSGKWSNYTLNEDRQPVAQVCYTDALAFVEWVSQRTISSTASGYVARLPDGEEWTVFAQCGDGRTFPWGSDWPPKYGNYGDLTLVEARPVFTLYLTDEFRDGHVVACPVERSGTNIWGLYGVGGNVWEWTTDMSMYAQGDGSRKRVLRGASWNYGVEGCLRCETRLELLPSVATQDCGFRLVLMPQNEVTDEQRKELEIQIRETFNSTPALPPRR